MNLLKIYPILFLLILVSCKLNYTSLSRLPKKQITIGSYGGYTGMNVNYIYLKNGQVYKLETLPGSTSKLSFHKQIPQKQVIQMFRAVKRIDFTQKAFAEPGNINTYINYKRRLLNDHYYQWDGVLDSTNQNFKAITNLMQWHN